MPPTSQSGSGLHADLVVQESSRLPLELCEAIIDLIRPGGLDDWKTFPEESKVLRACALVCRAWRHRAQFNLWRAVILRKTVTFQAGERVLPAYMETLRKPPERLAALVHSLRLHPIRRIAPLEFLMLRLPNLHLLAMESIKWTALPLRASRMKMLVLVNLTELRISRCTFYAVKDLFDIIWSCKRLSRVALYECVFKKNYYLFTEGDSTRLRLLQERRKACQNVTHLKLYGHPFDHEFAPAGSVLGSAVAELEYKSRNVAYACSIPLPRILASYLQLRSFFMTGFLLNSDDDPLKRDPPVIPALAAAFPNPAALRTIVIHVESSELSDERTIEAICGREMPEAQGDDHWWRTRMEERLYSLRDVLQVAVKDVGTFGLWDETPYQYDRKRGLA
ncbi:hypothetical protein OH77DRAFT_1427580 [Trametes cingulata]|nr:hypothetical protein OH77DRAFT_1427580 [Trametes cingulata]